jgi:hypothetical protein
VVITHKPLIARNIPEIKRQTIGIKVLQFIPSHLIIAPPYATITLSVIKIADKKFEIFESMWVNG